MNRPSAHAAKRPDDTGRPAAAGFTLVELLVVLAIIAVMLTLAVPRYYGQIDTAKEAVLRDNLKTTREMIDKFYGDTGRYPESLEELVEKRYLRAAPVDPVTGLSSTWVVLPPPNGYKGAVYDLKSGAAGNAKDGKPFSEM